MESNTAAFERRFELAVLEDLAHRSGYGSAWTSLVRAAVACVGRLGEDRGGPGGSRQRLSTRSRTTTMTLGLSVTSRISPVSTASSFRAQSLRRKVRMSCVSPRPTGVRARDLPRTQPRCGGLAVIRRACLRARALAAKRAWMHSRIYESYCWTVFHRSS